MISTKKRPRVKEDTIHDNERRFINKTIEKNRGMVRSRNKETKTPHTRSRKKFNEALKKKSGTTRKGPDRTQPYGGETHIKMNVTHSIPLK